MSKFTRQELEEKFGKPCIEVKPTITPQDPSAITDAELEQIVNCLRNSINIINSKVSPIPPRRNQRTINDRRLGFVQQAIQIAERNPDTVTSVINIEHWIEVLNRATILDPAIQEARTFIDVATRYERTNGAEAMQYFDIYYRCIRQLAKDGIAEAITIYDVLKVLYINFFGKTGPWQCPEDIINTTLNSAHNIIVKNKEKLIPIMKEQKFLADKLEHDIHDNIELIDGHYINRDKIPAGNNTNIVEIKD